jgi:hypothetical protein
MRTQAPEGHPIRESIQRESAQRESLRMKLANPLAFRRQVNGSPSWCVSVDKSHS